MDIEENWPLEIRFHERQVPEGTIALDGTGFRFCWVPACDGELYYHHRVVDEMISIINDLGTSSHLSGVVQSRIMEMLMRLDAEDGEQDD